MDIVALDHVQLAAPVGCEAAARRFYGELLGLEEAAKPEGVAASGGAWFVVGDRQLHIGVARPFVPALKAHPALRVARGRLDAVAARWAEAGCRVAWDERIAGVRRFFTDDPWGNRIELLESLES